MAEWGASFLYKELRVNAGKSKVMVGSSGGKMIVNSAKCLCDVCWNGMPVKFCSVHIMYKLDLQEVQWCAW